MGGTREDERLSIEKAAREWRRSHEEAEAIVRSLDRDRWIQVHYEALCEQTAPVLASLDRFLDLDPARPRRGFRAVDHHVVGNGMRLDTSSVVTLDRRWRSVLSSRDHQAFDAVAGSLNRAYGYTG
jgi:hypothetical protein